MISTTNLEGLNQTTFLNNSFFSKHQICWQISKEVARNWSGLLIDFFEDPRCHVNRPGSKCLVSWLPKLRAVLGRIPLHKRKSIQLIIYEYLYLRYLKYLVIAFFFVGRGGDWFVSLFFWAFGIIVFFQSKQNGVNTQDVFFAVEKKIDPLF